MDRISLLLSDEEGSKVQGQGKKNSSGKEEILKIIDDAYRKMQMPGAANLSSQSQSNSEFISVKPKEEVGDPYLHDIKVRCLCGISSNTQSMLKCEDTRCLVWQHINCVIVPKNPTENVVHEIPSPFYCEICRINRADPFWITLAHPLLPIKLCSSSPTPDGKMNVQNLESGFQLTRANRELLQRTDYDLQVWCILLNDKVPFRMQWPQFIDLQVNGVPVRTINRPVNQLLGTNGRDVGPVITKCSREGSNKIFLSRADSRVFCFGVRLARRRMLQQVLGLVPKESEGEKFEDSLARVCHCIGGGGTIEDSADSDSDLEVIADNVTVTLRCPMSGSRMKIPGRFKPCVHMACFDLETFVELNQRSKKWQCPICLINYTLENLIIDPYFNRIVSLLRICREDVNEIEINSNGSWRAKNEGEYKDLGQWHFPDGSLCAHAKAEVMLKLDALKQIKQEDGADGQTSLNLKRKRDGIWEVSKTDSIKHPFFGNHIHDKYNPNVHDIHLSNCVDGNYRDGEDHSVNQEGGGTFDFFRNNGHEFNSSLNFKPTFRANDTSSPLKDQDIIILSDSEEELTLISPDVVYDTSISHPVISETETFPERLDVGTSCLSLHDDDVNVYDRMHLCPLTASPQPGSGFQLFDTEVDAQGDLGNVQRDFLGCPTSNRYRLTSESGRGNLLVSEDIPTCPNTEIDGSLIDNPLAFDDDDQALQIFFPTRPSDVSMQADMNEHVHVNLSDMIRTDDWISLRLGGAGSSQFDLETVNFLDPPRQLASNECKRELVADRHSSLPITALNDDGSNELTLNRLS